MQIYSINNQTPLIPEPQNADMNFPRPMSVPNPYNDILDISGKQKKVGFKEGCSLIAKGFWNKVKNTAKSIIKHPLKTAAIIGGTTLALAALPLIGISTLTGAAALAIGFATIATGKTIKHTYHAIKHNQAGQYESLRKDLTNIGGDTLDLALSLPFVPKGLKQLQRQIKFTPGVQFNQSLWANVKNTKGFWSKLRELSKGDLQILYSQHIKEMGLTTAPELKFVEMPLPGSGGFNPKTGELLVDTRALNPLTSNIYNGLLKHELKHFDQYSKIARAENIVLNGQNLRGTDALRALSESRLAEQVPLSKINIEILKDTLKEVRQQPAKTVFQRLMKNTKIKALERNIKFMEQADLSPGINEQFWGSVVKNNGGIIKNGSPEIAQAQEYLNAWKVYPQNPIFQMREYLANLLEKEAYGIQKDFMRFRPGVLQNIKQELPIIAED